MRRWSAWRVMATLSGTVPSCSFSPFCRRPSRLPAFDTPPNRVRVQTERSLGLAPIACGRARSCTRRTGAAPDRQAASVWRYCLPYGDYSRIISRKQGAPTLLWPAAGPRTFRRRPGHSGRARDSDEGWPSRCRSQAILRSVVVCHDTLRTSQRGDQRRAGSEPYTMMAQR